MMELNENNALSFAKELTIKAIENGLIMKCADSVETAQEVVNFYREVKNTINGDE